MPVTIDVGENFSCQSFGGLSVREDFADGLQIAPAVWAGRGLPMVPRDNWERWIGELSFHDIQSGLVLTATGPERQRTKDKLDLITYGLILQGVPDYHQGFVIAGANEVGEPQIRQFGRARVFYPTRGMRTLAVGRTALERAVFLAEKIETINRRGPNWRRLRRAIDCLMTGSVEWRYQDERVHQFARCLEGLILPVQGSTRKQFVNRVQTFATGGPSANETLGQIFDIRSKLEHLHNALDVFSAGTQEEKESLLYCRARQVDRVARFALSRVLENDSLRSFFETDEGIKAFWDKPENERAALWGSRVELTERDESNPVHIR